MILIWIVAMIGLAEMDEPDLPMNIDCTECYWETVTDGALGFDPKIQVLPTGPLTE